MVLQTLLSLAQLHLALGDVQECSRRCEILLKLEPENDAGTLVSATYTCTLNANHFSYSPISRISKAKATRRLAISIVYLSAILIR